MGTANESSTRRKDPEGNVSTEDFVDSSKDKAKSRRMSQNNIGPSSAKEAHKKRTADLVSPRKGGKAGSKIGYGRRRI